MKVDNIKIMVAEYSIIITGIKDGDKIKDYYFRCNGSGEVLWLGIKDTKVYYRPEDMEIRFGRTKTVAIKELLKDAVCKLLAKISFAVNDK